MKLNDLFEEQRVIEGDIMMPSSATKLNYHGAIIKGYFSCSDTQIKSLEGSPSRVEGSFFCAETAITSLRGAPTYIGEIFNCHGTRIKSLHEIHKMVKHIGGIFFLSDTIRSNVLGVMLIKGLQKIEFDFGLEHEDHHQVEVIINKHLSGDRDVHACQEELLEAGLGDYAKL